MKMTVLGRTGLLVSRSSFGALPIQRVSFEEAGKLLLAAFDGGMNFFDTARMYTDSEQKIGRALKAHRHEVFIATKTHAPDQKTFHEHLRTSLKYLRTDYIDIYQLHHPKKMPDPTNDNDLYQALAAARQKGLVRFIGISTHRQDIARAAIACGLYDTLQYPLNFLSNGVDQSFVRQCGKKNIGFIAMKPMSGGLFKNAVASFAFLRRFANVVPIWGVQRDSELQEILALERKPPKLDKRTRAAIARDRRELAGNFCRACGYCLPCPAGIPIPMAARMSLLLRRMPWQQFMSEDWQRDMARIANCSDCGECRKRCPYGLDTPVLLKNMLIDYNNFKKSKGH